MASTAVPPRNKPGDPRADPKYEYKKYFTIYAKYQQNSFIGFSTIFGPTGVILWRAIVQAQALAKGHKILFSL